MIVPFGGYFFVNNQLKAQGAKSKDSRTFLRILISSRLIKDTSTKDFEVSFYLSLLVEKVCYG